MAVFKERLKRLIEIRIDEGAIPSEAGLARRVGISPRRLNHYSIGRSVPIDFDLISRLCNELGTHPNYLFGWSDEIAPKLIDSVSRIAGLESQINELRDAMRKLAKRQGCITG